MSLITKKQELGIKSILEPHIIQGKRHESQSIDQS